MDLKKIASAAVSLGGTVSIPQVCLFVAPLIGMDAATAVALATALTWFAGKFFKRAAPPSA